MSSTAGSATGEENVLEELDDMLKQQNQEKEQPKPKNTAVVSEPGVSVDLVSLEQQAASAGAGSSVS